MPECFGPCRVFWRLALRVLLAVAVGLPAAAALSAATGASPMIDTIVVKLRDSVAFDPMAGLSGDERAALDAAMKTPFSHVGYARDGALQLQLLQPLTLDAARAAVNRARLLPEILYANVVPPAPAVAAGTAAAVSAASGHPPVHRMIVKFRDAATSAAASRNEALPLAKIGHLSALAGQPVAHERAMSGGAYVVRFFQALPVDQARALARYLATNTAIEFAELDRIKQPVLIPNDPLYASQWHYRSVPGEMGGVNLAPAWDLTTGAAGISIAVIDTGSLPGHPDLASRFVGGYDFISDAQVGNDGDGRDADPSDPGDWITAAENGSGYFAGCGTRNSTFHGSHVAGTIGATTGNSSGVAGINWVSGIVPARALGKCGGYTSDIADAIRWSAGIAVPGVPANPNPARVLNLSLGGYACDGNGQNCSCETTLQNAINAALGANAVVVVAAANSNVDASQYSPANCNGVITVGATGRAGQRASYSNYGPTVEVSAPGGSDGQYVLSTLNNGATSPNPTGYIYASYQGTSMATPHVSGIASLMLSRNPALTPSQVVSKIQTTARAFPTGTGRDCTTALCGAGIIDAAAAVLAAGGQAATQTTTTLGSGTNPALVGAVVTLTATVAGTSPTGTVNFTEGGSSLPGCAAVALTGTGNSRTAACSTSTLAAGTHNVVASYGGDAGNLTSTSTALAQVINAAPVATTTTLASGSNPALVGAVVTLTATVAGTNPTGTVNFTEGGSSLPGCAAVALTGTGNSRTAACSTSTLAAGTHNVVASYGGDAGNLTSASAALAQAINAVPPASTNVALASAGAVASASSSYSAAYPVAALNNNERAGVGWGSGGGWMDGTGRGVFPDWVQIDFNGSKTIDRVVVYTLQDNYTTPVEPTDNLTFAVYGVTDYTVQGWNGTVWVTLATVTGNNLVKRTSTFAAFTTNRIRVNITNARLGSSRLTEIEAWGAAVGPQLANGIPGVLEKLVQDAVKLPRIDGLAFDHFGNLFGVLEVVSASGGVVYIDKGTGAVTPIALNIPGACRLTVHPNGDIYASSELPIELVNGVPVQFGGLYRVAVAYDGANRPVSGTASKLATVLDSPEGIQPLLADGAYGSAGMMLIAEDNIGGRIVRVMPDGSGLTELVGATANVQKPEGLAFGDFNGTQGPALYAAEKAGGRIMRIGADGSITTFGNPAAIGGLNGPDNIAFGPDGYLYVGEKYGGRIVRIAGNGTHSVFASGFDNIEGVAFDPLTGDLYIAEIERSTVWRVRK